MGIYKRRKGGSVESAKLHAAIIILVPAAILVAGYVWLQRVDTAYEHGPDLCLTNRPLTAHSVLIIDRTDIDENQVRLEGLVKKIKADLEPFEKLTIYTISGSHARLPTQLFSMCNPGTAQDVDIMVRSPNIVQKKFDEEFAAPIEKLIRESLIQTAAPVSPIIETLQILALIESFNDPAIRRRIYLFSDMLQNTEYSHYRNTLDFAIFARRFPDLARIDLNGVDVYVEYVRRKISGSIQGPKHIKFWREFFKHANANLGITG